MKKLSLLLILFIGFADLVNAQTAVNSGYAQPGRVTYSPPNETSLVKDSDGVVYPYLVWHKLMQSGDYSLSYRTNGAEPIMYMLVKRTQQEKEMMMASMPKPKDSDTFKTGDVFKPFKDKDLSGQKIGIKELAGKVIVLNFWFIGCPPCRAEIPDLKKLSEIYKDNKDVIFVAIALDEGYDVKDFVKTNPLGEYHLLYSGRYLAGKYGVKFYPTNVVIGRDGKVAFSSQGGWPGNANWMQKTIDQALKESVTKMAAQ